MLCDFQLSDTTNAFTCQRCGQTVNVHSPEAARRVRAECQVVDLGQPTRRRLCTFLGPQVGEESCGSCRGRVTLKVFQCLHERHDRTTLPACGGCPDYSPAVPPPEATRLMLLRFPHGFGDAVQLTTVLLHLRELFPHWTVDVAAKLGAHTLFEGLCRRAYTLEQEPLDEPYDVRRTLWWHEPEACYSDSPSTKAEKCLREVFLIQPREALCRYTIEPGAEARRLARDYAMELGWLAAEPQRRPSAAELGHRLGSAPATLACDFAPDTMTGRFVLLHYQGNSARQSKNIDERIIHALCEEILLCGYVPVVLDWDGRSGLVDNRRVFCPAVNHPLWRGTGTGDGATIAALAELAAWCVGIDSGPGHVFAATKTPTTIIWMRHHPLHYFGLAENVTHLVPCGHRDRLRGDREAGAKYFEANYAFRTYADLQRSLGRLAREMLKPDQPPAVDLRVDGDHWVRREHRKADMVIVRDVYLDDCYGVSALPRAPRFVVDIGAHIGAFAQRVHRRNELAKIVCVEANAANLAALAANVGKFAEFVHAACTYEPGEARLLSTVFAGTDNTGGSTVVSSDERWTHFDGQGQYRRAGIVPKITLEEIVARNTWPRIDLLKLDCEGSEFSILEHCDLKLLNYIVGEYHGQERFHELVRRRFAEWNLRILRDGPMGLFWLRR